MANWMKKVITGNDALRDLHETMLRHRSRIVRIAGDDWGRTLDEISSGGDINKMNLWCAAELRLARRLSVPVKVRQYIGNSVNMRPASGRAIAGLCAAIDGTGPIVGGITALCRGVSLNPSLVTRIWVLGDLGVEGYAPLADALNSRVARLPTVQTPEQATAEAKARVEARQQHLDEIAAAKLPQARTWRAKGKGATEAEAMVKAPESAAEVAVKGEPIAEPIKSAAQAKATYRAHVTLRSGGTLDVTASEISVDDSGVLLEGEGMSLALNSQAVAEVTIKWEVR